MKKEKSSGKHIAGQQEKYDSGILLTLQEVTVHMAADAEQCWGMMLQQNYIMANVRTREEKCDPNPCNQGEILTLESGEGSCCAERNNGSQEGNLAKEIEQIVGNVDDMNLYWGNVQC